MNAKPWLSGWVLLLALPAMVQAADVDGLRFEGAWIRDAPPASPVRAAYLRIVNEGKGEMLIESAQSADFGAIEMHEMREVDGVMRMRPLPRLQSEPGSTLELAPGGKHLMLFRPARELQLGDRSSIEFVFADGSRREVEFEVRAGE